MSALLPPQEKRKESERRERKRKEKKGKGKGKWKGGGGEGKEKLKAKTNPPPRQLILAPGHRALEPLQQRLHPIPTQFHNPLQPPNPPRVLGDHPLHQPLHRLPRPRALREEGPPVADGVGTGVGTEVVGAVPLAPAGEAVVAPEEG